MHEAFILTTVQIEDTAAFARYRDAVGRVNAKLGGDMLIRGRCSQILEGTGAIGEAVAALGFPSADEARAYIASKEYRALAAMREEAGQFTIRLVT